MFIYTLKASSLKFFAVVSFSILALLIFVSMVPQYADQSNDISVFANTKIKTNEDRINFLREQGLSVEQTPCQISEVVVPKYFDSVYEEYNNIQKSQGLDLEKYQGKTVTRYTYIIEDYNYDGTVIANIITYKNKIIAGDICSTDGEGFVKKLIG